MQTLFYFLAIILRQPVHMLIINFKEELESDVFKSDIVGNSGPIYRGVFD